ncbi:hypothetical protein GWP85_11010 [Acinetobacter beijerinckii]|uniref:hypothetical protein n=1 Tax=Acinetobacter beijerinckii TaxID=262668 RepID=UPI0023DD9F98|nr:hypothetical protein [Acinetobacter beijerinckii]MDF2418031.1 hypothetical protein [Acinetobacter beijerinckii]
MSKSLIAKALLGLVVAENSFEKVTVEGLGDIGVKLLTAGDRSKIYAENQDKKDIPLYAVVMKETIVDPETGELALADVTLEQLARLSPSVVDDFAEKTFHLNGFTKRDKAKGEQDLKN